MLEEIPSVKDALNEYFRLKSKFENENNVNKKKIINNPTLSKREKRAEYLKLMPKCVNCKRPSRKGTIFSITFVPSNDNHDSFRRIKAICGNLADPCNLNIEINLGNVESLDKSMSNIKNDIDETKNIIINDKNKLLFGLITTETALENFDYNKSYINDLTSIYESYLDQWNKIVDNPTKKSELEEDIVLSYQNIDKIKECIKQMNENNDTQFANDAANIYFTTLEPLLKKIRQLKYSKSEVIHDDSNDTCRLIQRKYDVMDLLISGYTGLLIESDSLSPEKDDEQEKISIVIKEHGTPKPTDEIEEDEPIIGKGKDGIAWNNPKYQELWNRLSEQLKVEFKSNIDWMKGFMNKCVNERKKHGISWNGCKLTSPPNLVIPPRQMENGQYDFGVSIYNKAFNKMPKTLQQTYLTFYSENPSTKEKNYNMLINAMNDLVEKEVNFGRGFF